MPTALFFAWIVVLEIAAVVARHLAGHAAPVQALGVEKLDEEWHEQYIDIMVNGKFAASRRLRAMARVFLDKEPCDAKTLDVFSECAETKTKEDDGRLLCADGWGGPICNEARLTKTQCQGLLLECLPSTQVQSGARE